jgi:hypothetical protein
MPNERENLVLSHAELAGGEFLKSGCQNGNTAFFAPAASAFVFLFWKWRK